MTKKVLGVLGGMGPAAGARFYSLLTAFTKARCDREHMEVLIHSIPSIPDRTAYILKKSLDDPLVRIRKELLLLEAAGAKIIAVPCNTAEYFYARLQNIISVPIISITRSTVKCAYEAGAEKVGILATEGTIYSGIYQNVCELYGLKYVLPDLKEQKLLNDIIYEYIKKSLPVPNFCVLHLISGFLERGCDALILGCTELSLISSIFEKESCKIIDSLEALAVESIKACGYEIDTRAAGYINKINRN